MKQFFGRAVTTQCVFLLLSFAWLNPGRSSYLGGGEIAMR